MRTESKERNVNYPDIHMLIDGQQRNSPRAHKEPILNPANLSVLGTLPFAEQADLDDALAAAQKAFPGWRRTSPVERENIFRRATALMRERVDRIAAAITLDQGKPLAEARQEILRSCAAIEWEAAEGRRLYGRIVPGSPDMFYSVVRQPIGVIAAFSPWNAPINTFTRMVVSALAAGCTVISKPSEEAPSGPFLLAQALFEAGLPAGALNLVFGKPAEISEYLIPHPVVRLVSFTGSVPVGKHLASLAGSHMKPVVMELGGHAPVIVCSDADPDRVAKMGAKAKFRNSGQICTSPTRFFVHKDIYSRFVESFVEHASTIVVGDGLDASTQMGPLANDRRVSAVHEMIKDAVECGAELRLGGAPFGENGYFFSPTVLANVPDDARIMREEPFGPVAVINSFDHLDDAIQKANALSLGLAAYVFTNSARDIRRMTEEIEAGNLCFNHYTSSTAEIPTGGVKDSGYGRAGGIEGQACYTIVKNVSYKAD
jgi:succinate-semialdehyde dehydrogenase/glutarate-semialdehyde dehydrogenase